MSNSSITEDARRRPELFRWNGPMSSADLQAWLDANPWMGRCPSDLLALWKDSGGGDVFETETILGPAGEEESGDDIVAVNREFRSRGMPVRFVVYHLGLMLSAFDSHEQNYVELERASFQVVRRFGSLDEWYQNTLRAEYAQRYGLR